MIFALAFPGPPGASRDHASSRRTGASLLLRIASVPGFVALVMLMFGPCRIPLAFLLPSAYIILTYGGFHRGSVLLAPSWSPPTRWPRTGLADRRVIVAVAVFFIAGALLFVAPE
jgi:predicted neutral ceramidase superfamily lipid hydrolase